MKYVLQKMAQIEPEKTAKLSEHTVKLALLDDLKKLEQTVASESKSAYDEAKKVQDLFLKVNSKNKATREKMEKLRKEAFSQISDAYRTAKELGIELPREFDDRFTAISDYVNKIPVSINGNIFPI